jgi:hypothetical protein
MATPAPDLVPDEVAQHRARQRKRRREPQAEVSGPGQGAGAEEKGALPAAVAQTVRGPCHQRGPDSRTYE